jgi:hypothetical protein
LTLHQGNYFWFGAVWQIAFEQRETVPASAGMTGLPGVKKMGKSVGVGGEISF